jgi:hypothetical protein
VIEAKEVVIIGLGGVIDVPSLVIDSNLSVIGKKRDFN